MVLNSDDESLEERIAYPPCIGTEVRYADIWDDDRVIRCNYIANHLHFDDDGRLSGYLIFAIYTKDSDESDEDFENLYFEMSDDITLVSRLDYRKNDLEKLVHKYASIFAMVYNNERETDEYLPQEIFEDLGNRLVNDILYYYEKHEGHGHHFSSHPRSSYFY